MRTHDWIKWYNDLHNITGFLAQRSNRISKEDTDRIIARLKSILDEMEKSK